MHTNNLLEQPQGVTAVGSGDWLGHWSLFNLLIELLLALGVGTLIVCSFKAKHPLLDNMALSVSQKIASLLVAIWIQMTGLRDWLIILKQAAQLAILDLKLRNLRAKADNLICENVNLRRLHIKQVLLNAGGRADADDVSGNINGIDGHNVNGAKWPNVES